MIVLLCLFPWQTVVVNMWPVSLSLLDPRGSLYMVSLHVRPLVSNHLFWICLWRVGHTALLFLFYGVQPWLISPTLFGWKQNLRRRRKRGKERPKFLVLNILYEVEFWILHCKTRTAKLYDPLATNKFKIDGYVRTNSPYTNIRAAV